MSAAADRFVTALLFGWPFLLGALLVTLIALWVAGLVELDKSSHVTYTRTPDEETQRHLTAFPVARIRAVEQSMRDRDGAA